jgi:hypothetical protein
MPCGTCLTTKRPNLTNGSKKHLDHLFVEFFDVRLIKNKCNTCGMTDRISSASRMSASQSDVTWADISSVCNISAMLGGKTFCIECSRMFKLKTFHQTL